MRNNPSLPRWLTLKAAAAYSAIGRQRLIDMARSGAIRGGQDQDSGRGEWIFDRESIDAYREGQMLRSFDRQAETFLRRFG
ncbi:MAG: helix-turn-helix domain-containing protein [Pseudomonadota bacterium]